MIFIKKKNVEENDFVNLLASSKKLIVSELQKRENISPTFFESLVHKKMCEASRGTDFEGKVVQTGTYAFPDIIANKFFGVEVKMTTQDHWTSTGNSVLETSRVEDVKRIYIMFGKLGGDPDVKYRLYQECLPEVSVTHSPRYRINMDLEEGKTIFDKIGVEYDFLREQQNPIKKIKEYYRDKLKEGEELWWIDLEEGDRPVSPIIKPYRNLSEKEKENFIVETLILFPEIFSGSQTKFERPAAYLITKYNAVSANLRDIFTAGGQVKINIEGTEKVIPKLLYTFYKRAKAINEKLPKLDEHIISHYWKVKAIKEDRISQWQSLLKKNYIGRPKNLLLSIFLKSIND